MIKPVPCYTVICDACGCNAFEGTEMCGYNDQAFAEASAEAEDWHTDNDKHYCSDCYFYNDDDELVIKATNDKL